MKRIFDSIISNLRNVYIIIPAPLKRQYLKVSVLSLFLALNEFLGVAVLIPFFNEIADSKGYTYVQLYNLLPFKDLQLQGSTPLLFSLVVVVSLLIIKNTLSMYVIFKQYKFSSSVQARISEGLFATYLGKSYSDLTKVNSSELIRNTIQETNKLNESVIIPSFLLITDFMLVLTIGFFLLVTEPLSSIILFVVMGSLYGTSSVIFGKKLTAWGKERFVVDGTRMRLVQEGLGSFVDIKLRSLVKNYMNRYRKTNDNSARYSYLLNANLQAPKHLLEVLIFVSLLVVIFADIKLAGYGSKEILRVLGLFAISSYKLLPTLSRITNAIQTIRFYKPSMDVFLGIDEKAQDIQRSAIPALGFEREISIHNVSVSYDGKSILKNVTFTIARGETIGIIGKSGSGKTTLAHCIMGLVKPTDGQIEMDKTDIQTDIVRWMKHIGYVPQTVFLLDDTIQNNITLNFDSEPIDINLLKLAVDQAGLNDWINSLPDGFESHVGERGNKISGGQLQRIGIARALYKNPDILVLDEATSALDTNTEKQFLETIETLKKDKTIIFITHKKAPLSICSRVLAIENGSIKTENQQIKS
jgi:ATP-binding cassette, subfamily B, bacterial PglK